MHTRVLPIKVTETLTALRGAAEDGFSEVFCDTQVLAAKMDIEITRPRTVGRQTHRDNVTAGGTEQLFRQRIYISFLENITSDLVGWRSPKENDESNVC